MAAKAQISVGAPDTKETKEENIVLAHNSAIFSLATLLAQSAEARRKKWTIIINDFWLDKIQASYKASRWGQLKRDFPILAQDKIIPEVLGTEVKDDDFLTFDQFRKIRDAVIKDLENLEKIGLKVKVIRAPGDVQSIETTDSGFNIKGTGGRIIHQCGKGVKIYNTIRKPKSANVQTSDNRPLEGLPQSDLYTETKEIPKDVLILGNNVGAAWLVKNCREKRKPPGNIKVIARSKKEVEWLKFKINEDISIVPDDIIHTPRDRKTDQLLDHQIYKIDDPVFKSQIYVLSLA